MTRAQHLIERLDEFVGPHADAAHDAKNLINFGVTDNPIVKTVHWAANAVKHYVTGGGKYHLPFADNSDLNLSGGNTKGSSGFYQHPHDQVIGKAKSAVDRLKSDWSKLPAARTDPDAVPLKIHSNPIERAYDDSKAWARYKSYK